MTSDIYPFLENKRDYPQDSFLYMFSLGQKRTMIEFDSEVILEVLNNKHPLEDFSFLSKINKDQLNRMLEVITKNIVEVHI
jgi:hypothetical protein